MTSRLAKLRLRPPAIGRRLVDLLGSSGDAARQSLLALVFNSVTSLIAGVVLGSITDTFEALPGLLVMIPAAIGLRGNIFGALGNRISTSIHSGTFRVSTRRDSVVGQNVLVSLSLTCVLSLLLAVLAKVIAVSFGVQNTIGVVDLALVSIVGGVIASIIVLVASIGLTMAAVRKEWDLDNLVAPTMSTLGDVITVPSLFLATKLLGHGAYTSTLGWIMVLATIAVLIPSVKTRLTEFRQIFRESIPVLTVALTLSTLAGIAVEKRLVMFAALPALLILQPAFVSSAGALGGILSSRMATNLHLGVVSPELRPGREAKRDALIIMIIGFPIFLFNGVGAHYLGLLFHQQSPGLGWMVGASMIGGFFTVIFVIALAYYGTIGAWRATVDPDTYGIPIVTASVDFVGVVALISTLVALHVG